MLSVQLSLKDQLPKVKDPLKTLLSFSVSLSILYLPLMPRYLTKSRFKLGLDCPPKLYFCNKKDEYADQSLDDSFLAALAEGGFQVGELAKYLFCDDPVHEKITIEEKDYEQAILQTNKMLLDVDGAVVAEAAFRYENLFVRVDITTQKSKVLNLYEVKAKSWNSEKDFWKTNKQGQTWLDRNWLPYLYDIAFQKYVVQRSCPGFDVKAHMIFADADMASDIEGLNQKFRIEKVNGRSNVRVADNVDRVSLGSIPLKIIPVDLECEWIYQNPVAVELDGEYSFEELIQLFSVSYEKDQRLWSPIGNKCKGCQFTNSRGDNILKSGFNECWSHWAKLSDSDLKMPLALELWGGLAGAKSIVNDIIRNGKYHLSAIEEPDYWPKKFEPKDSGLHPAERRKLQVDKIKNNDRSFYLDKPGLNRIFDFYEPPYHFIDFETTAVALPFHAGRKPYEGVAFQYSYHTMDEHGKIEHANQFISIEPGFPNYDFVRALRRDLHGKKGTIFRYHNHENTYLCHIYKQLLSEPAGLINDREELLEFIRSITHSSGNAGWEGASDMVDLWKLVLSYYYSPVAKGSNSIKHILPAVINDSAYIRNKYAQPIYGSEMIPSLNFTNHCWIKNGQETNPYKTLPSVLDGYHNDDLDQFVPAVDDIAEGGAAMMAYAYLQFSDVPASQKELIKNALYRYCELDTMAMVMIWEFWGNEIGRFK